MSIFKKLFEVKKAGIKLQKDTNGFNYKYATLEQIQNKIGPLLEEKNILLFNKVENQKVITVLLDVDTGEDVKSELEIGEVFSQNEKDLFDKQGKKIGIGTEKNSLDPQGVGSIITYYRRYNLLLLLDLEVEDDDGVNGSKKAQNKQYTVNNTAPAPAPNQSYGKCVKCGADNVKSPTTGKIFCAEKCWLK